MHDLAQFLCQPLAMEVTAARSFITTAQHLIDYEPHRPEAYLIDHDAGEQLEMDAMSHMSEGQRVTAVVPLWGALSMHGGQVSSSTLAFSRTMSRLDESGSVATVIVWINSPGGTVTGTAEAANALRAVRDRGTTKTISVIEPMMASAATWIGAAAGEVVITPSGEAGSIGVISMYEEWSKALEAMGINIAIARTPDKKARFTGVEPMNDEMWEEMLRRNGEAYEQFVAAMAKNRGVTARHVKAAFGGGEMLGAIEAQEAGLVDRIATLDEVIAGIGKPGRAKGSRRAEDDEAVKRAAAVAAARERLPEAV